MGGAFLLAGTMIFLIALNWIAVDPARIHAPRWVLGLIGGMFALSGLAILYFGIANGLGRGPGSAGERDPEAFSVIGWLLGLVIVGGMAVVAGWIAFGPGERAFSGSIGVGGVSVGGSGGSETVGRWFFGIGAVLTGAFGVWGLVYGLRRLAGRRGER